MSTAVNNRHVVFNPTELQVAFIAASEREVLMGGGNGSGKSAGLLMCAAHAVGNREHKALLVRKSFPQLRDLISRSLEIFPHIGGTWNEAKSTWKFRSGARVEFGYIDGPQDYGRYLGREFNFIGFDELCEWDGDSTDANGEPVSGAYLFLISRLRTTKTSGLPLEVRATCVPGGPGKSWVQTRWRIGFDGGPTTCVDPSTGFHRRFIRALLADNPHIDPAYEQTLRSLSEAKRKAYLLGRWDSFEGQIFDEFSDAHVCRPFLVPEDWELWRGADDGYASPACCLWIARDPLFDRLYVTNEIYQTRLTAHDFAEAVLQIDTLYERDGISGILDSAAWSDIGNGSRAEQMNRYGCRWRQAEKGPGSRIGGIAAIHDRLALKADGLPGLRIFDGRCPNLVRELRSACYATKGDPEDTDAKSDHAIDALRYAIGRKRTFAGMVRLRGL